MHLGNEKQVQVVRMSGVNYNFEFIHGTKGQRRIFSIRAINKCNGRFSSINNLNTILSLLYVEPNKTKFEDSLWEINMKEIEAYKNIIIEAIAKIGKAG